MGECYGCYKTPAYISALAVVLLNSPVLIPNLCLLGSIGGALAGFVVGALRGFRAGKDASKDMGFFKKVGTIAGATIFWCPNREQFGCYAWCSGNVLFLAWKNVKDDSKCDIATYLCFIHKDVYLDKSTFIRENQWSESLT